MYLRGADAGMKRQPRTVRALHNASVSSTGPSAASRGREGGCGADGQRRGRRACGPRARTGTRPCSWAPPGTTPAPRARTATPPARARAPVAPCDRAAAGGRGGGGPDRTFMTRSCGKGASCSRRTRTVSRMRPARRALLRARARQRACGRRAQRASSGQGAAGGRARWRRPAGGRRARHSGGSRPSVRRHSQQQQRPRGHKYACGRRT